ATHFDAGDSAEVGAADGHRLPHTLAHIRQVLRTDTDGCFDLGAGWDHEVPGCVSHFAHDAGRKERATIGDGRDDADHLDRRGGAEALSNAHVVGVAEEPVVAERRLLPLLVRNHALRLTGDVDAGLAAEAELTRVAGEAVDAEAIEALSVGVITAREVVEVDVR